MSRMTAVLAVLALAATVAFVPSANAATPTGLVVAAGSSAMWQTLALAAYNNGACGTAKVKLTPPCKHWTDGGAGSGKFNLNDTRPTLVTAARGGPGTTTQDAGHIWIVWDSAATPHYWAYINEDSGIGDRCYFAVPQCNITAPSGDTFASGQQIAAALWGADSALPASLQTLFGAATGPLVNTGATDVRAEDALFATCRANSALGNASVNVGGDGTDGLGYNANNPSGVCPVYKTKVGKTYVYASLAQLVGTSVSGADGKSFHINAWALSGDDPFSGKPVLASSKYTTIDVGIDPVVFVTQRNNTLSTVTDASSTQLQTLFSGTSCDANAVFNLGGMNPEPINVYLREPLSGTYNTTEATVMRRPLEIPGGAIGTSMELYTAGVNPLNNTPCHDGNGARFREIGTGDEVAGVKGSTGDAIGFTFFSFGNVSPLQNSASYGYLTLGTVDPIFLNPSSGAPGQLANQELPGSLNVCSGLGFPCSEAAIWGGGKLSFPNVRAGDYPAWSLLRLYTSTTNEANVADLVAASHSYVVNDTPDYIPATAQPVGCVVGGNPVCADPGVQIFHTHYQQEDGSGALLGLAGSTGGAAGFNSNGNPIGGDQGGDMGGCIISTANAASSATFEEGYIQIGLDAGGATEVSCSATAVRP